MKQYLCKWHSNELDMGAYMNKMESEGYQLQQILSGEHGGFMLIHEKEIEVERVKPEGVLDFDAYTVGLCTASVCSCLSIKETIVLMNTAHPTGISSKWQLSQDTTFETGEPMPCPCNEHPETHKHYLFEC